MKPVLLVLYCAVSPVMAATFEGSLELQSSYGYEQSLWQKTEWVLTERVDVPLSENIKATAIGRLRYDLVDRLTPQHASQSARSHTNRRYQRGDHADAELREAYLDLTLGAHYLRLGKQQVAWGQADGVRVLDVLNPLDYREFILPEIAERRIPLWMLNAESPVAGGMLQSILIVDPTFDQMPEPGATFAFRSPIYIPAPPAKGPVRLNKTQRPAQNISNADIGLRYARLLKGWDVSLNYLYHYQDQAIYTARAQELWTEVTPWYQRSHLLGASAANAFGDFAWRMELGYSTDKYLVTQGPSRVGQSPELAGVLGLDYTGLSDTFLSVQWYQSSLIDTPTHSVRSTHERQFSLLVRRQLFNEALALEAFVIQNARHHEGLLQLKARYQFNSQWSLRTGVEHFYGDSTGLFGQFGAASRVVFGVSYAR